MSYELTNGRLWPLELVRGEYPNRGQDAVEENKRVNELLAADWEPFAVESEGESTMVWFRRKR